jgi:hypothetical protein
MKSLWNWARENWKGIALVAWVSWATFQIIGIREDQRWVASHGQSSEISDQVMALGNQVSDIDSQIKAMRREQMIGSVYRR